MNYLNIVRNTCFVLFIIVFARCNKQEQLPILEDKLVAVLADVHVAEVVVEPESQVIKDSLTYLYYLQIFERNGVKKIEFDSSMSVLSRNPDMMERVYKQVVEKIKNRYVVKKDSIK